MQILPGFDSYHKYNRWLPLRIALAGDAPVGALYGDVDVSMEGELTVEFQDSATETRQIYSIPVNLSRASKKVEYLYILPESSRRNLLVRLIDGNSQEVLRKDISLLTISPEDLLIVVIASRAGGLEFLADAPEQEDATIVDKDLKSARIHVSYPNIESLPDKWKGYDSVDVIVLGDVSTNVLSIDQQKAITDWLYGGGRLIVSGGAHSQNLIGTFVEDILPVKIKGTRILNSIPSLSEGAREREIGKTGREAGTGIQMLVASTELSSGGRAVITRDDGLPVIAERKIGDGKVIFLAFDYLDPALPLQEKSEMWADILPQPKPDRYIMDRRIARLFADGSAIPPSYKPFGFFLLSYILCTGVPGFFILKKAGRAKWIWISMPAITAVFIIGSLGFIYLTKVRAVAVDELSIVDVYQEAGRARVNSYFSLLPPDKSDYTVELPSLEAMFISRMPSQIKKAQRNGNCKFVQSDVFRMEVSSIENLSTLLFNGESFIGLDGKVSINVAENHEGSIQGEIISDLPFDLSECYFFSEGRYIHVGDLPRGVKINLSQSGDVPRLYSVKDKEKQRFINSIRQSLSQSISGTGIVGWMDESALRTLVKMNILPEYESQGIALIIVHI